jgi:diadenosine tetraphosphate (Ap4A) HIT family hydrolase
MGRFPLSHLLLMNDANYPWFILVPDMEGISEIYQLPASDQQQLMLESCLLGKLLMTHFKGDKLNIGALGNMVPQLHLHHIVRYRGDAAWPAPVWGRVPARPYAEKEIDQLVTALKPLLMAEGAFSP